MTARPLPSGRLLVLAALALAVAGGIAFRVWVYGAKLGIPNSDEAQVGLEVRHILKGEIPVFFWGQAYGGSQEALLTAPLFALFGQSWLALRFVPILLGGVATVILWRVGRRTTGEPGATAAAALFLLWPPFVVYTLTQQLGFYASDVVYCGLVLLLALRVVERPDTARVALYGLVVGLAVWETTQIVPIVLAATAWVIWQRPASLRKLWVGALAALVGVMPSLVWNITHHWASLHLPIANHSTYVHRVRLFFSPIVPMLLGLRSPYSQQKLLPGPLTALAYLVVLAAFLYGAWRTRRSALSLLYLTAATFPFVYAIHPETVIEDSPRYTVVLAPVVTLLVAQLATTTARMWVLLALAGALSTVTLIRMDRYDPGRNQPEMAPRDLAPLVAKLDALGADRVYADYWIAYRLDFDTHERVVAVENKFDDVRFAGGRAILPPDPFVRHRTYEREVEAAPDAFVFFRDRLSGYGIVPALERHRFVRTNVGPFAIFTAP